VIFSSDGEMVELRAGLKWFFFKHMNAQRTAARTGFGGGSDVPTGEVMKESSDKRVVLKQRVQKLVDLLGKTAAH
jgi:hypothetical protein